MTPRVWYPQIRAILQVVLDGFGEAAADTPPMIIPVLPKSVTIHRNRYTQADSWEMTFEVGDLPIDPQLIRAGAAEIYLRASTTPDKAGRVFSRTVSELEAGAAGAGETLSSRLDFVVDRFAFGGKPAIIGLFDEDGIDLSDGGKWVTLQGQDYTALLLAVQWKPDARGRARRIPVGQRLDDFVTGILAEADPTGRMHVAVRGVEDNALPVVGATEVRGNARGIPVEAGTSCWDVIYKVVTRHGFIAFVDGLEVVISKPKNLDGRDLSRLRRFAWGKNVESLRLSRKFSRDLTIPSVVVRSYDDRRRRTISVEYPPGGTARRGVGRLPAAPKAPAKSVRGGKLETKIKAKPATTPRKTLPTLKSREEFSIFDVHGITDEATLRELARAKFHMMGRAEREIVMTTHDLEDLDGKPILDCASGDAFEVVWDEFNLELLENDLPPAEKAQRLVDRGFNASVAEVIAERYEMLRAIRRPLYLREASIDADVDDGISHEFELVDFVVLDGLRDAETRTGREARREELARRPDGTRPGAKESARLAGRSR